MREQSRNVSVETVQRADEMATAALSLLDANATGEASVNDLLAQVIGKAGEYRTSRVQDASDALLGKERTE